MICWFDLSIGSDDLKVEMKGFSPSCELGLPLAQAKIFVGNVNSPGLAKSTVE